MRLRFARACSSTALFLAFAGPAAAQVDVRAGIDVSGWDRVLGRFVDDRGAVDYAGWKASAADRRSLSEFLGALAGPPVPPAEGAQRVALLVDAYNALTVSWILENFPTGSIRSLPDSFAARRHVLGGRRVSLDEIESELRRSAGYRVHAAISCASRSCPPLSRSAYRAPTLETRLDEAMRTWLAREDLNAFFPREGRAEISMIFRWYAEDFARAPGGLRGVLARFAPAPARSLFRASDPRIAFRPYDWSLNEARR